MKAICRPWIAIVAIVLFPSAVTQANSMTGCDCTTGCENCLGCSDIGCSDTSLGCFGQSHSVCSSPKSLLSPFTFYGWAAGGFTANNHGNTNLYGAPQAPLSRNMNINAGNSYLHTTEQQTDIKLNQLWFGMSKPLDTKRGLDWGFQADYVFGTDARYAQNFGDQSFDYDWGSGDYYSAIVQLYGEVGSGNTKIKIGKFGAGMFHESYPQLGSFFYSHAFLCFNTALTVHGAVVEHKLSDRLTFSGGWTSGYHSGFGNRYGDNAFLGSVTLNSSKTSALKYSILCNSANGRFDRDYDHGTELIQTLVFTNQLNPHWFYMIEGLWVDSQFENPTPLSRTGPLLDSSGNAYGINQHLIYTINPKWSVGLRGEWHRAMGRAFFNYANNAFEGGTFGDLYALTLGANWNVCEDVMIRPELRHDWANYNSVWKPFANGTKSEQLSGGVSMVVKF